MSMPGRTKTYAGGDLMANAARTVASATALPLPDFTNLFYVTGSTTVTTIAHNPATRNRLVTLVGATGANFTLTNNTGTTTVGQMDLGGANINVSAKDVVNLFLKIDGTWQLVNLQKNNASTATIASATPTIPDTGDIFSLSGTSSITTWTMTTPGKFRRLLLIGAASANVTLVDTASPSSGQMNLKGSNRTILEDYTIELLVKSDGTMTVVSLSA